MVMFAMNDGQFQLVYNVLSFSLASMMATTLFLWMRVPAVGARYQTAVLISGRAGRLLRFRHHLQVRCRPLHLPDHGDEIRQRKQELPRPMNQLVSFLTNLCEHAQVPIST